MPVQQLLGYARYRHGGVDVWAGSDLLRRHLDGDCRLVVPRLNDGFGRYQHLSSGQPFACVDDQIPYTQRLVVEIQVVDGTNVTVQGIDRFSYQSARVVHGDLPTTDRHVGRQEDVAVKFVSGALDHVGVRLKHNLQVRIFLHCAIQQGPWVLTIRTRRPSYSRA